MAKKIDEHSDSELYSMLSGKRDVAEKAFTELFNRHSPRVFSYCRRFLGDREEALDVFQETFIRFHQSADKNKEMTNVPGFIITIARNLCMNAKRKERPNISFEEYMISDEDESPSNDNEELLELIKKGLDLLPDDYREIFVLREYNGLSYNEIAELQNTSLNNVKVRIHRAKQKLKEILQPYLKEL